MNSENRVKYHEVHSASRVDRSARMMLLAVSLISSAHLLTLATSSPAHSWLAWISLAPLFIAVRYLSPIRAALSGAFWGSSLYLFSWYLHSQGFVGSSITPGFSNFLLLTIIPAAFVGFGSLYTRRFGFSPLALATGWVAVELCLQSVGLKHSLLAADASYGPYLQVIANLLGYGFVAFLVAYTNALLLSIAAQVSFRCQSLCHPIPTADNACSYKSIFAVILQTAYIQSLRPRAPPFVLCS